MPDVNHHSVAELREHARYYIGAVRTDAPENLTHNAQMLANLVERLLDEDGLPEAPDVTIESFVAAMESADLTAFPTDEQDDIKRAYHLLEAVANEAALRKDTYD